MLLTTPGLVMAQKDGERRAAVSPQERAEKKTAKIDALLSLTPEQRQRISAENLRAAEAMQPHIQAIRSERAAMREISKKRHQAYASILTPEQMSRLKEARKKERPNARMNNEKMERRRSAAQSPVIK